MIRQLDRADIPAAAEVIRASFATVAAKFSITEQNCPNHTSFITAETLQKRFDSGWLIYGLYDESRMAGAVALSDEGSAFELHHLAVLPDCRHRGYGIQLLGLCKAKTRELGGAKLVLSFIEENSALKAWYIANGFVYTGAKKFPHLPFTSGFMEWECSQGG
ncbi:MAG: GNAT family N-acetyltransferase [Oscillospiraceae bacterium]|nr:GNAT family N-acetyltransferase [Oscillospiraceae bacterium]